MELVEFGFLSLITLIIICCFIYILFTKLLSYDGKLKIDIKFNNLEIHFEKAELKPKAMPKKLVSKTLES